MPSNLFRCFRLIVPMWCLALAACGSSDWRQFHADGQNQGNINVNSRESLDPKWNAPVDIGEVSYSSPVIDNDGTIYIGTIDGTLVAVSPAGMIKWKLATRNHPRLNLSKTIIVSSPAIGSSNDIYFIASFVDVDNEIKSALIHVLNDGSVANFAVLEVRAVNLPTWTTSSPKVLHVNSKDFVFVSNQGFLYVFDSNCQQISRQDVLYCAGDLQIGTSVTIFRDYDRFLERNSPYIFEEWRHPNENRYWIDPSVAIVTKVGGERLPNPLVVVATNQCGIQTWEWIPPPNPKLNLKWNRNGSGNTFYTSPSVSTTGQLILAYGDGYIISKDVLTGKDQWLYQIPSKEPILASTAFYAGSFYVVGASLNDIYVIDNNVLVSSFHLPGETVCSPALSYDRLYLSTRAGLHSLNISLSAIASDASLRGGMSSPAIAADGTIYFASSESGKLMAYKGK